MITYESRLAAALRSLGAEDHVIVGARSSIRDYPADDDLLTTEFGEPEDYARALMPGAQPDRKIGLMITGCVLSMLTWFAVRLLRDAGWEPIASWWPLPLLLPLLLLGAGIAAQFWRYLRGGVA